MGSVLRTVGHTVFLDSLHSLAPGKRIDRIQSGRERVTILAQAAVGELSEEMWPTWLLCDDRWAIYFSTKLDVGCRRSVSAMKTAPV